MGSRDGGLGAQRVAQAFDDWREAIRVQLSRWMTQGKVVALRRGMYTLSETYRRTPLIPAVLANQLYRPSYLSGLWALGHYDLIPERVVRFTSVTPRVPRRFENPFGVFDYRNIKQDAFFGSRSIDVGGGKCLVAEPEKALLDHWHLTEGEWTSERLDEMRYQHVAQVDAERLQLNAQRFRSPRLNRLREYLQAFVLRSFHESEAFRPLAFVGGTALRFLHDLPRFSEDLDFSLVSDEGYAGKEWMAKVKRDLALAGFNSEAIWKDCCRTKRVTRHAALA